MMSLLWIMPLMQFALVLAISAQNEAGLLMGILIVMYNNLVIME